jgi:pimeloyl-ACP methyl ester carboxylesterase
MSLETIMSLPTLFVPGLGCSARLYANQIPQLWRHGPVTVADTTRDDTMAAMARRILADAPPRFALAGLSMGGYIALEIMRPGALRSSRSSTPRRSRSVPSRRRCEESASP